MDEQQINEILEKKGYKLDRVVRFKTCDRVHWHSKDLKVSINLGKKIEDMAPDDFAIWVM